jgi:D-cysteine desulfhydrase
LFLRTENPTALPSPSGNLMLDRLVDAEVRFITADQYQRRDALMAEAAADLNETGERAYVIPEGGSNGRGALGYVQAMREVRDQLDLSLGGGPAEFDAIVHACGSGGTAAGVVLGAGLHRVAPRVFAMAVCDDRATFERIVKRVVGETRSLLETDGSAAELRVVDEFKGPAYGQASAEQLDFIHRVARGCGLILDPVYSGKALFALARLEDKPQRALFIHTGGLPGLLAQADSFSWE